jgi:hypothetical protein
MNKPVTTAFGNIVVSNRNLISLVDSPNIIHGSYDCSRNKGIRSLASGPKEVTGAYFAHDCSLTTIVGAPQSIGGSFDIDGNPSLLSLVGGPKEVGGHYSADNCGLSSLEGLPVKIGGFLDLSDNPLTSLKGINQLKEMHGDLSLYECPITSHILGVFFINGCGWLIAADAGDFGKAADIVNRHISKGRSGLLMCTQDLIEAGLDAFAQI